MKACGKNNLNINSIGDQMGQTVLYPLALHSNSSNSVPSHSDSLAMSVQVRVALSLS